MFINEIPQGISILILTRNKIFMINVLVIVYDRQYNSSYPNLSDRWFIKTTTIALKVDKSTNQFTLIVSNDSINTNSLQII